MALFHKKLFLIKYVLLLIAPLLLNSCGIKMDDKIPVSDRQLKIEPDYTGLIIPPNIAPLNFNIKDTASAFFVKIFSSKGNPIEIYSKTPKILISQKKWKELLKINKGNDLAFEISAMDKSKKWSRFRQIKNKIAAENIDPYLYYRILYPGYESWTELSIDRRNTESFTSQSLIKNSVADENCINCHSFNNGRTDDFLFHMRGSMGGTYFYSDGKFRKVNLKTTEMKNGAVYPRWHPSGKFVAFSTNLIRQRFHSSDNKKVEVEDLESSLVLYDVEKNEIMNIELPDKGKYMDTYPEWSPDGRYLYFCRTEQITEKTSYKEIKYNLYRVLFDPLTRTNGEPELVFDASAINKSISFPRISPDGKFLIATLADYGCFPVWHKESDLYLIDLSNFKSTRLSLNSDYADSYHSWSSNGRWLLFSSKRGDGLTASPYISYIDENGISGKPFILPQKDPDFYGKFLKSFNIPEFSTLKIGLRPGEIRRLAKSDAISAKWIKK